ncbi:ABC transporter permease [Croceicoccus marinus]|uniref:ABC transporter permease n=1 Tax=Croceicoccus marinus TaxID=450378 RepID=A0A7G6VX94_9SPHN|nr:ABC transporter permease [Croceicoccus marinus]QNE06359.1 ABC transporter permease [Croceicoccus marinus]
MSGPLIDRRRLTAMIAKEIAQIMRDPSTFLIAFILPLLLLFLFGYALNLDSNNTRIGIAIEDSSAPALSLASAYRNNPNFQVITARSIQPLKDRMVSGEIRGILVIPQDFGRGYARGDPPPVQIIADGSMPNTANFTRAYAEGLLNSWMANEAAMRGVNAAPPIDLSLRYWYNPSLTSRNFLVPGAIAIVMTMIGTLLTSLVIAREWERGTMEAMMATPMHMAEFLISKIVPYFVLALASMALCTLLAVTVFGVPLRGSPLALFVIAVAYLMPALGQGLFISAATKNQFVASQIALLSGFLPTFLLSGFMFEISSMPPVIQAITYIVPARYFVPLLQTVFLAGDIWPMIWPNVGIMLLFGAGFFALCIRFTRRSLD